MAGVLAALKDIDYEGWLVVEQDIFPQTPARFAQAIDDQKKKTDTPAKDNAAGAVKDAKPDAK